LRPQPNAKIVRPRFGEPLDARDFEQPAFANENAFDLPGVNKL
jgi:hypothetical protein